MNLAVNSTRSGHGRLFTSLATVICAIALLSAPGCSDPGTPAEDPPAQVESPPPAKQGTTAEKGTTETPDLDHEQTAPGDQGPGIQATATRLLLPEDFPDTVPLLLNRRILSYSPRDDGAVSLTYSTPQGREEAASFYREELAAGNWEVTLDSLSGGMTSLSARKEDGGRLTVSIIENPDDRQTMIGIYHHPGKVEDSN